VSEGGVEELVIEEESGQGELVIEEGVETDELIIEDDGGDTIVIDEGGEGGVPDDGLEGDELVIDDAMEGDELVIDDAADDGSEIIEDEVETEPFTFKVDELWVEYGYLGDSNSRAVDLGYLHAQATANWKPSDTWEFQLSARVDGYSQSGRDDWDKAKLDYDESFVRYRSDEMRVTLGTQKVIWGRIDEFPPTDRLSTYDLTRYVLDDLADRRRASPVVRVESFFGDSKLDLVYLPKFREAELPGKSSVWYPVNTRAGEIFGLKSTPATTAIIQAAPIDDSAPDSDGGFGMRYSEVGSEVDYAVSIQRVRQSTPYFSFNPGNGVLEAKYPRSWVVGGDLEFEGYDATWRMEAAWSSDAPVTRTSGSYTTVNSMSWGMGVEFFPGDGDTRVNLQLTGINHINAPSVIDRTEIYALNGSLETPFADDQWRAKARFYLGLDKKDVYLNPEIAYTGWESHELYLEGHFFSGSDGTPGGYHKDHSTISLGWRAKF
ncbi:MAG: hypothetical protein GY753_00865, partial [Gammaproteobacteria bacterium]|nr:hypothetical protein [Gammaproteobacteria bacterium]